MKKILLSLSITALITLSSQAGNSFAITLLPGTTTNVVIGACVIDQIILNDTSATNANVVFYDAPTGTNYPYVTNLLNPIPSYTNTVSYATNYVYFWTNYWGATTLTTNIALVDLTNNLVVGSTNTFPVRLIAGASGSSTYKIDQVYYNFINGVVVSNTTPATVAVTVHTK